MRLRATAGAHAGEIREYSFTAGRAALKTGMAVRIEEVGVVAPSPRPVTTETPPSRAASRRRSASSR